MKRTAIHLALALPALAWSAAPMAADPAAGKAKTITCVACHGQEGVALQPEYPNLACQNEKYLAIAIKAYKDGTRDNALMKPMVAALSDDDVANLAAYYASLPCKS
ncbi:MAG: c-type cytochrome [Gammaproteobacteria bacterium]